MGCLQLFFKRNVNVMLFFIKPNETANDPNAVSCFSRNAFIGRNVVKWLWKSCVPICVGSDLVPRSIAGVFSD